MPKLIRRKSSKRVNSKKTLSGLAKKPNNKSNKSPNNKVELYSYQELLVKLMMSKADEQKKIKKIKPTGTATNYKVSSDPTSVTNIIKMLLDTKLFKSKEQQDKFINDNYNPGVTKTKCKCGRNNKCSRENQDRCNKRRYNVPNNV